VRALLLALVLFLGRDVQALNRTCATFSREHLIACLQDCPDAERGVACRRTCIHEHNKAKSACNSPPVHVYRPYVTSDLRRDFRNAQIACDNAMVLDVQRPVH
jgi:hypothetical protein